VKSEWDLMVQEARLKTNLLVLETPSVIHQGDFPTPLSGKTLQEGIGLSSDTFESYLANVGRRTELLRIPTNLDTCSGEFGHPPERSDAGTLISSPKWPI